MFAGIGAFRQALKNQNIPHEVVAFSEIDKYAVEAYRAIHGDYETPNLGDIKGISHLPDCDLLTYGFPCQDLSIAGKGAGIKEGTRSGLLIEVERLLDTSAIIGNLPKVLILENVKALVQKKHKHDFDKWLRKLEDLGYTNYWQVLNAKDYGIPQNRERVFVISILGEHEAYEFPEKQELKLRLSDLLEKEVDKKYYLSELYKKRFDESLYNNKLQAKIPNKILGTTVNPKAKGTNSRHWVYDVNGLITTIDATTYKQPKQIILDNKLRKITPRECFRLMGFTDDDFDRVKAIGMSDTQLYKQAGNSIVVNVLEAIFKNLYKKEEED